VIRTYRMVVAESVRTPQVARIFYEAGPAVGVSRLASYLETLVANGSLRIEDCHAAAGEFLNLCRGHHHFMFVLNLVEPLDPEQIRAQARQATAMFIKSYGG